MKRILPLFSALMTVLTNKFALSLSSSSNRQQVHTLVLCRHGDSIWNGGQPGTQETFTGWTDVPLSQKGIIEARNTAAELALYPDDFDACFTSILGRARETAHSCCWALAERPHSQWPMRYISDYRLNERHYGALQGYIKSQVEQGLHGHDKNLVQAWRRSWYAIPPLLDDEDPRRLRELKFNSNICGGDENVPRGESLEMVAKNRIRPFLNEVLHPHLDEASRNKRKQLVNDAIDGHIDDGRNMDIGGCGLVVAHANSLRALIGVICKVEEAPLSLKKLEAMKIETGVPLILKYMQLEDGTYQAYDFIDDIDDSTFSRRSSSDLPVWPLSCIPKNSREDGQFHYSTTSNEIEKKSASSRRLGETIRIDVI